MYLIGRNFVMFPVSYLGGLSSIVTAVPPRNCCQEHHEAPISEILELSGLHWSEEYFDCDYLFIYLFLYPRPNCAKYIMLNREKNNSNYRRILVVLATKPFELVNGILKYKMSWVHHADSFICLDPLNFTSVLLHRPEPVTSNRTLFRRTHINWTWLSSEMRYTLIMQKN